MPFFVTPSLIATAVLVVLVFLGLSQLFVVFRNKRSRGAGQIVLELSASVKDLNSILSSVAPPFSYEVAVSQLGRTPKRYISVPARVGKKIMGELGAEEVDDYDIYYSGGVSIGAYLKGETSLSKFDESKIDLSEVNEIGEGAVVQLLFNKKRGGKYEVNGRLVVSAPSVYQAKEIMTRIKLSLPGFKFVEVKNEEFMERVNSRKFDKKEEIKFTK